MRRFNQVAKYCAGLLAVAAGSVMAAVPIEVNTALADGKTDTLAVAGLALVIIISVAVFKYMRKGV